MHSVKQPNDQKCRLSALIKGFHKNSPCINYSCFKQHTSIFRSTKGFGHRDITVKLTRDFNTWMNIFCTHCVCLFPGDAISPFKVFSTFSFLFSNLKAWSVGMRSSDWLGHWRFAFKKSWVAFTVCLGSLSICARKFCPISFCIWWV